MTKDWRDDIKAYSPLIWHTHAHTHVLLGLPGGGNPSVEVTFGDP